MNLNETMIAWNPGAEIMVGPWPDRTDWAQGLRWTAGACFSEQRDSNPSEQVTQMLLGFHACVVRDGIDPQDAHREFLKIAEYRKRIAPDIPAPPMAFKEFCRTIDESTPIGDFCEDYAADRRAPDDPKDFEALSSYLGRRNACFEAVDAARAVWARRQGPKRRRGGSHLGRGPQ